MGLVVIYEAQTWSKPYLKSRLRAHKLVLVDGPVDETNARLAEKADVVGVFIYSKVTPAVLSVWKRVRHVATFSTGFDHVDLAACAARGITVSNVPAYGSETVAEHSLALMLALAKKIVPSVERTRKGDFALEGLRTFDLEDKTLGLLGFGKIGSHLAKTAKALGMHVRVYDPHADSNLLELLTCKPVGFDELLRVSDIISLHVPLNDKTRHIIDAAAIAKMKKGVILINTARGGLIDTQALVAGLKSGHVAGAGLDVLEGENDIKEEEQLLRPEGPQTDLRTMVANHILLNSPNVIITPHNAFNSVEALRRIVDTTIGNIEGHLAGHPSNLVKAPAAAPGQPAGTARPAARAAPKPAKPPAKKR